MGRVRGGQSGFTSFPVSVQRVAEVPAARFFPVKCITSTDEFLHWNEGPDRLRGAWKAKFYTVKPRRERDRPQVRFTPKPQFGYAPA